MKTAIRKAIHAVMILVALVMVGCTAEENPQNGGGNDDGGGWHMPSHDEFFELFARCGWSATIQNGVKGLKVSASNGNSLFLPVAGYKVFQMLYQEAEGEGFYWINQTHWNNPMKAWSFFF